VLGGLFSVTLSVTRNFHSGYPRFHEACRLLVFGLSSGQTNFKPAIACHCWKEYHGPGLRSSRGIQRSPFAGHRKCFVPPCKSCDRLEGLARFEHHGPGRPECSEEDFRLQAPPVDSHRVGYPPTRTVEANRQFSDETGKICVSLSVRFPRAF